MSYVYDTVSSKSDVKSFLKTSITYYAGNIL